MCRKKITRRDFIKGTAITGAGLALGGDAVAALLSASRMDIDRAIRDYKLGQKSQTEVQAVVTDYMSGNAGSPKVIHVHDPDATSWNFSTGWYGDFVNQAVVDNMVDKGVMELTGTSTVADAWATLIPNYTSGEAVAIKVSFNNAWNCSDGDNEIDALIQPVNALIRGLRQIGVTEQNIWVYEAIRGIPDRFVNGCLYSNIQYFSPPWTCGRQSPGWNSNDPDAFVTFNPPSGPVPSPMRIPDVLINATYLINMPIIKRHSVGVSLGFKNHFGTIASPSALHDYIDPQGGLFSTQYSPFIDIHKNPHIGAKTILTIGDALFGAWTAYTNPPSRWTTFGNAASNSLIFSTDPVALDCVMYDILVAETTIIPNSDVYMSLAADAGIGVFEHGDPWGSGYNNINYVKVEL
jgi:hypothetical protein